MAGLLKTLASTLLVAAIAPFTAFAEEPPCHCNELPSLFQLSASSQLADLSVELNDRFATLDGHAFYRTPGQIESYRLKMAVDEFRKKSGCLVNPRTPSIKYVVRAGTESITDKPKSGEWAKVTTLVAYPGSDGDMSRFVQQTSTQKLTESIGLPETAMLKAVFRPKGQSLDQALAPFRNMADKLKIETALHLGDPSSKRYDNAKYGTLFRSPSGTDKVTRAAGAELTQEFTGNTKDGVAGDCADTANAQGAFLQSLGMKNVYIVNWTNSISLHTTVVAQGRDGTWYKLNYTVAAQSKAAEGGQMLRMPGSDASISDIGPSYHVSKVDGRTVGYVPSEIGKVMAEMAGMKVQNIEPLARATSSVVAAQMELADNRTAQIFTGRNSSGDLFAGVGINQSYGQTTHFPGSIGAVADYRSVAGIGPVKNFGVADLYVHLQQDARTSDWTIGREIKARIDASLNVLGYHGIPLDDSINEHNSSVGFGVLLNTGAQVTHGTPESAASGRVRAEAQFAPGLANMGGMQAIVYLNHMMFTAEGRVKLGETAQGRAYLAVATTVMLDYFGPRILARIGVETPKMGARIEVRGRLLDDTATVKEGSLRRVSAAAGYSLTDYLRISIMGEVLAEGPLSSGSVTGGVDGRF